MQGGIAGGVNCTYPDDITIEVAYEGFVESFNFNACNDNTTGWAVQGVNLGTIPPATTVAVMFDVAAANRGDCFVDSYLYLDDIKITPMSVEMAMDMPTDSIQPI
jgi:hypothetical protein